MRQKHTNKVSFSYIMGVFVGMSFKKIRRMSAPTYKTPIPTLRKAAIASVC